MTINSISSNSPLSEAQYLKKAKSSGAKKERIHLIDAGLEKAAGKERYAIYAKQLKPKDNIDKIRKSHFWTILKINDKDTNQDVFVKVNKQS